MNCKRLVMLSLLGGLSVAAHADDYGCTVLLCLANPNGPRAVSECVPPINRLFRDLARGRAFPSCAMASAPNSSGGRSWAQQSYSYYDVCPSGTTALGSGLYAVQGASTAMYRGIGEGDDVSPGSGDENYSLPGKVCVGNKIRDTYVSMNSGDDNSSYAVGVYDRVVLLDPASSPRIIDVYVDSALARRVRW